MLPLIASLYAATLQFAVGSLFAAVAWALLPFITSLPALVGALALSAGLAYGLVAWLERDQVTALLASRRR